MVIRADVTSAFKGLITQQVNRNLNKLKCCTIWMLAEKIAEAPDITWKGQGRGFRSVI